MAADPWNSTVWFRASTECVSKAHSRSWQPNSSVRLWLMLITLPARWRWKRSKHVNDCAQDSRRDYYLISFHLFTFPDIFHFSLEFAWRGLNFSTISVPAMLLASVTEFLKVHPRAYMAKATNEACLRIPLKIWFILMFHA